MKQTVLCRSLAWVLLFAASIASADPDAYIVNTESNNVSVIDTANNTARLGSPIAIPQTNRNDPNNDNDGPFFIVINRTGTRAYIADASDDEIEVFDLTNNNTRLTPIPLGTGADPRTLAFKPGTDFLYVVLAIQSVRVIDTSAGGSGVLLPDTVPDLRHNGAPTRIVFNGNGSRAYVGNRNDPNPNGNVAVINTTTPPGTRLGGANDNIPVGPAPVDIVYDTIQNRLLTANFNDGNFGNDPGNVSVLSINPATDAVTLVPGQPISLGAGFKPTSIALNPDRSQIFVTQLSGTLSVFNNGASVSSTPAYPAITVGNLPTIPAFRADGRLFVPNRGSNSVSVFNTSPTTTTPVITLTNAQSIGTGPRRIAIRETAGAIQFNPTALTVAEDVGNAVLTVTRPAGSTGAVMVTATPTNGPATGGAVSTQDFNGAPIVVSFGAADLSRPVNVPITNDTAQEGAETFTVVLSAPTGGATLGAALTATVTISANDAPGGGTPPPPAAPPAPADDGGGGGCAVNPSQTLDPTLLLLLLAGAIYLNRRRQKPLRTLASTLH